MLNGVKFIGASGSEYEFGVYPWGTKFRKNFGAVYFVTRRKRGEGIGYSHTRIYIGQTDDLSTRFDDHHKQSCFDREKANCVCIYGIQDESVRLRIEKDLIDNYHPVCQD
jgi:predicted GIY-YIG superfamily endonuclease